MRTYLLAGLTSVALLTACGEKPATPVAEAPPAQAALGAFGIDLQWQDAAVKPGDDFFKYANGKWLATYKLPDDKARYGSFDELGDKSEADIKAIIDGFATATPAPGSNVAKAADLYTSWMDEAALETRGIEPLKPYLDEINAITDKASLLKVISKVGYSSPFGIGVQADAADPKRYAVWSGQGGIAMPDRDYYLKKDAKYDGYRAAYKTYVTKIFELLGDKEAAKSADTVIKFETEIAKGHWTQEDLRVMDKALKPMPVADFKKLVPNIDLDKFAADAGIPQLTNMVAYGPTAVTAGAKIVGSQPIAAWKKYLTFHIASDNAAYLSKAFDDASFEFFGKTLRGVQAKRDRWKRGVAVLDGNVGEALGQAYADKFFPAENKAKMEELVGHLQSALKGRIEKLDWMDEPTRAEALKKLANFEVRVGYPKKWRDYSALQIDKTKLFENVHNAQVFEWNRTVSRLNQPVDRDEWDMNAQTVNASYNPIMNQITFPAGILQPPFFDVNADPAVNYGAIGGVIGHEISHGFDDQGSAFDDIGVQRNWWTPDTLAKFKARTGALNKQYDGYCPLPNKCVSGKLTTGENIGDLGGLLTAYTAYKESLGGKEAPVLEVNGVKYTGDQRFFLSWAQVWRSMGREDDTLNRLVTDPHSPPEFRVDGVMPNVDAWYDAFGVKEGDKMYVAPDKRVRIW
ncbi:MAG TPA: M13 family metallopeptidase [Hyphomonadaceae bacterium]|jgi:endothelin-converting enzyme/putative endopeptidase|nr:M13 family metallopeptidase [Hyphomonadaceae bacterium]